MHQPPLSNGKRANSRCGLRCPGVFDAGLHSARDPKYTVVPQRERMAARQKEHASTVTA